ncbi:hypothetical protein DUI87_23725 [Hirundo rustica rustica]|uniref:Uncharacterized protein n=1 Tax=Hirundo rustica rustica TaxID=333673 RepID=A0A3M0JKY6_HIRRU|nr:hypothetical protein DUI87_23725 [Hirundo rustica rustica]
MLPTESLFYRAVLQVIIEEIYGVTKSDRHVGKTFSKSSSFIDYVRRSLKKLELDDSKCRKPFPWTEIKASVFLGSGPVSQTPLSRSLTLQGSQRNALDSNISPSCLNQKHLFGNPVHGLPYASKQTRQDNEKDYKPY